MSARVRLSAPVCSVLIMLSVKDCLVVMTDMLDARAEDWVLSVLRALSSAEDEALIAAAPVVALASFHWAAEPTTALEAVAAAVDALVRAVALAGV